MIVVPHGFGALIQPTSASANSTNCSFVTSQVNTLGVFDQNVYYGFDFGKTKYDNLAYLAPTPTGVNAGTNVGIQLRKYGLVMLMLVL